MLPHIFAYKRYIWAEDYMNSTNRMQFVVSANQVGKSTQQIIKCLTLAMDQSLWARFFPKRIRRGEKNLVFWYVYPDQNKINEEFRDKWEPYLLPRGVMKHSEHYGWRELRGAQGTVGIAFSSGVTLYFKTPKKDAQASTIDAVFVDEEKSCPPSLLPEFMQRLAFHDGMFSMVFTATVGYSFYYDVIERRGHGEARGERYPKAAKWQISLYDCMKFSDGSPSHFTEEEINKRIASCGTQKEVLKRVFGRFITADGLKYPEFDRGKNIKRVQPIDKSWNFYGGIDVGKGGKSAHPAAISIVAVRPDFKYGRVVKLWKGPKEETTTSTDILNQYLEMSEEFEMTACFYDFAAGDFSVVAERAGVPMEKAEKNHDIGESLLNLLFKNEMLDIDACEHSDTLAVEFEYLKQETDKKIAEDDQIDSLRYAVSKIPWDVEGLIDSEEFKLKLQKLTNQKRTQFKKHKRDDSPDYLDEMDQEQNEFSYVNQVNELNSLMEDY